MEWPGLKRTTMLTQFQPPAMCRVTNQQTRLPRATSSLALNAYRDGASTTSLGNLFRCVTTLWVKNLFLISNLNLPCLSLKPSPLEPMPLFPELKSSTSVSVRQRFHSKDIPCAVAPQTAAAASAMLTCLATATTLHRKYSQKTDF